MITKKIYTWIEKLLDSKTTKISDKQYTKLVEDYFKRDKSNWFEEYEEKKEWDEDKVRQFWELIRKYVMPRGEKEKVLNFEYFIFPEFENIYKNYLYNGGKAEKGNFWNNPEEIAFNQKITFNYSKFLGNVLFANVLFNKQSQFNSIVCNDFIFGKCVFKENVFLENSKLKNQRIIHSTFEKDAVFTNNKYLGDFDIIGVEFKRSFDFYLSKFYGVSFFEKVTAFGYNARFSEAEFQKEASFFECKFESDVEFMATTFFDKVEFVRPQFLKRATFNQAVFNKELVFNRPIFKEEVNFSFASFEDVNFIEINREWRYRKENYTEPPILIFKDVFFNNNTTFQNTNLQELTLINCDVTNVTFSRCEWNDKSSRLKLKSDLPQKSLEKENKIKKALDSENHYRQLKKNFDTSKNWELSGKAYVSEMEMRKHRLFWEGNYAKWIVYWFYSTLGGYTQNFIRPFVILLVSIIVFAGVYFLIDFIPYYSINESWELTSISKSFQKSFDAAFPFFKPVHEYQYWWIKYFQTFFCGTLLTFFILALRKRFKQ